MDKKISKLVHMVTFALLVIGGLNLGLAALVQGLNIVNLILGSVPILERIFYILVGLSAVYIGATHMQDCKICSEKKAS
ncbi:hypothetical protein A3J17_05065 [Candidatus Curtissbacteria bacterium RIFCSPLOWO2_02_FULL_40_11]|uniref:DUF378 domain-containing protein n=2 Tax=Candidatus Curtissiibacteriota TaxID=1752717 RepID=A0A1F5G8I6_9BACT|nr:MAG: hypothetical protein A3D04_01550 [Candidatus Curtissbacteria bacterium RIFCSPHIGHO2_02_FULL_40_16b]OGD90085.1 MAG: hypothetical protein A3E11_01555 [Candidatus Curtissbacteria bacterium RIFCSPHIGHO2_12_FULL_38_37]OGE00505.1 MAG: hypothetical protein A3J17_05065 [Candidatus Curtissbacteria bacterium RIFCSPLOWO2_02_FULL_40_11]OGE13230.1 MAG: hypothetical protein A3G14_00450 [Candidatus Curtissbacteria bacterium RIFCSPLOWO2_12_FULL_38_9]